MPWHRWNPKKLLSTSPFPWVGEYYKRDIQHFFNQMPPEKQQAFLDKLKLDYRQLLLNYFNSEIEISQEIEQFINKAFCNNIPVPQIIKIHMELIDEFSKQLKLEGRNDEILLDYRLTLIDILAHLCEKYRCYINK